MTEPVESEPELDEIASQSEMADFFHVRKQVVNQWHARRAVNGFPEPLPDLYYTGSSHVPTKMWVLADVVKWREAYRPVRGQTAARPAEPLPPARVPFRGRVPRDESPA